MPNIQVRNVPPKVHRVLKAQAAHAGMSLSEYLLDELRRLAMTPTPAELMAAVRERPLFDFEEPAAELIRRERDAR
jgi:antitoxin FitA